MHDLNNHNGVKVGVEVVVVVVVGWWGGGDDGRDQDIKYNIV